MSRFHNGTALAVLAAAATLIAASGADAQTYGRLVVFGDSLSDNGNLYAATGGTQPPSPPYFQGRFSSGPTFVELLGFTLGRSASGAPVTGSIDYAYGGSRTDSQAFPPGMRLQLQQYTAAGGRFGASDLVSILGGANNIFQGLPAAGASANPTGSIAPVALAAATDINFITNSVAAAGAGTILVSNLPKLSLTPQFRGTSAATLADFAAGTFNDSLRAGLFTTAAAQPNTNIIMMDLFKIGDTIANNPGQFGITNATAACFNGVTVCTDPGYFYFDGVHPTALGHRLIAQLANDYLYYGDRGAQTAVLGETAYRHREDALDLATEGLSGRGAWAEGTTLSMSGSYDKTDTDARGVVAATESEGYGARVAVEHGWSETWKVGVAGGYRQADVTGGGYDTTVESYGVDVYGGWRSGNAFVNAAAGGAYDRYDLERLTAIAPVTHTGTGKGGSVGARIQGGLWADLGGIAVSPRVGVSWISSRVEGFNEAGAAATYAYGDRTVEIVSAEASLRAEADLGGFAVFVEGGYRDAVSDNTDAVRTGIADNPAQVLSRQVDEPFGGQIIAAAGLRGDLGPVTIDVGYRGRYGDKADSHMGGITLTLPLQ